MTGMSGSDFAVCIECGCDDDHACPEGCWWLRVDYPSGLGVCSGCEMRVDGWDAGERGLSPEARLTIEMNETNNGSTQGLIEDH